MNREGRPKKRTMTSTVSYKFKTTPSSSRMGTADIERSENMWTTSNTGLLRPAVAIGSYVRGASGDVGRDT